MLGSRRVHQVSSPTSSDCTASPALVDRSPGRTVAELEEENFRLKRLMTAKRDQELSKCGYLFKYRPYASGLLGQTWELRFFSLTGSFMQYYKSEKDTLHHPRGHVLVKEEGMKRGRYFTFSLVDQAGLNLLRMSTRDAHDARSWVEALVNAGAVKQVVSDAYRVRSPLRSADIRWRPEELDAGGIRRVPSSQSLSRRWSSAPDDGLVRAVDAGDVDSSKDLQPREYTSDQDSGMSEGCATSQPSRHTTGGHGRGQMKGSSLLHTESRPSMLSADRIAFTQHSGILNLMTLILLAANARLILENLLKYGILTNPAGWIWFLFNDDWRLMLCWPFLASMACLSLAIEWMGARCYRSEQQVRAAKEKRGASPGEARRMAAAMARRTETLLAFCNTTSIAATLVVPCAIVEATLAEPVPAFVVTIFTTILFLKLTSFAHCNHDLRERLRAWQGRGTMHDDIGPDLSEMEEVPQIEYPANLTPGNLAYFLVAPTLVYQTAYPRSSRFRPRWLLWYGLRLVALMGILLIITEQYMQPTIANSLVPLYQLNWARIFERLLKLSIPTLYGWIFIFYTLFHVWLNILAELTGFGDREFYKDWWNATTIGDYWRLWNVPVHKWMLRHVYYPAIRHRVPKPLAAVLVFGVSAFFHELLVGLPLHMVRYWAFIGVLAQVPLLFLTDYVKRKVRSDQIGNFTFWFTFCIFGQPMAILLYVHDWVLLNRPEWVTDIVAATRPAS